MISLQEETKSKKDNSQEETKSQEDNSKKRDWIDLLLVPLILAVVGGGITWFNNAEQQKRTDQSNQKQQERAEASNKLQKNLADKKQRDTVLTQYIQNMKELLLDKDHALRNPKKNDVSRDVARALTKTTLQQLPSKEEDKNGQNTHKASVLSFLSLSGLIKTPKPIVMLGSSTLGSDMDFSGAYLPEGYLEEAALSDVNLSNANLAGAYLNKANLAATRLDNANLKGAQLGGAYLFQTYLFNAKNLTNEQIKSACNWKSAVYTEADENLKPKDAQANQKRIQEIENDKASDPKKPVDCSQWKEQGLAID